MHVGIIVLLILRQPRIFITVGETAIPRWVRFFLRQCGCCGPAGDELCFWLDIRQKGAKLRAEKDTCEENRSMAVLASIGWTTKFPDFIHDD